MAASLTVRWPRQVVHVDLRDGLPDLRVAPGYVSLYVVLWWQGIPLGHDELPADRLPMPRAHLVAWALASIRPAIAARCRLHGVAPLPGEAPGEQALSSWIAALDRTRVSAPGPPGPTVAVVVCTRDRPAELQRCLRSLACLSPPPAQLLVVDNAPGSPATRRLVEATAGVGYVAEPVPGLDRARNAGIRHSTADIVAFVDDDVVVDAAWLAGLRAGFADAATMAVTGLILPAELETEAQCLFERDWSFHRGYRAATYDARYFARHRLLGAPTWEMGAGANMAFRREVFAAVGLFDVRLDAGAAGCSGDSEMWYRILAAGLCCRYEPTAVAHHYHRREGEHLRRQLHAYMRGHVTALLIQFETHRHWRSLRRLLLALPVFLLGRGLRGLLHGFRGRYRSLPAEVAGCAAGLRFYWRHRR